MNLFEYLFPTEYDEPVDYVYIGVTKNRLFVVKKQYGHLLNGLKCSLEKMRVEHINLLKDGVVNEIKFNNQLKLL